MNIWLTSILPVASALAGVFLADRSSGKRDATARLWERRADTYLDMYAWAEHVEKEITNEDGILANIDREIYLKLLMADELLTRMWVFASTPVRYAQGPCRNRVFLLSQDSDDLLEREELGEELLSNLDGLGSTIRNELSEGKLTIPLSFRISELTFPLRRRVRLWRLRRRARRSGSGSGDGSSEAGQDC